ncbi:MAG: hypothetical protein WB775_00520 [Burkholderiaceae bacterium]
MFSSIVQREMVAFSYHYQSDSRRSEVEIPDQPVQSGAVVAAMQHQISCLLGGGAI